jgi:hypothetical protein
MPPCRADCGGDSAVHGPCGQETEDELRVCKAVRLLHDENICASVPRRL